SSPSFTRSSSNRTSRNIIWSSSESCTNKKGTGISRETRRPCTRQKTVPVTNGRGKAVGRRLYAEYTTRRFSISDSHRAFDSWPTRVAESRWLVVPGRRTGKGPGLRRGRENVPAGPAHLPRRLGNPQKVRRRMSRAGQVWPVDRGFPGDSQACAGIPRR